MMSIAQSWAKFFSRGSTVKTGLVGMLMLVLTGCEETQVSSQTDSSHNQGASQISLELAAEGMEICKRHMPDIDATKAAFKSAGISVREQTSRYAGYSLGRWQAFVHLQDGGRHKICSVRAAKMLPEQAVDLAQTWVQHLGAEPIEGPERTKVGKVVTVWRGASNGIPGVVVVYEDVRTQNIRGASIKLDYLLQ